MLNNEFLFQNFKDHFESLSPEEQKAYLSDKGFVFADDSTTPNKAQTVIRAGRTRHLPNNSTGQVFRAASSDTNHSRQRKYKTRKRRGQRY